MISILFQRTDMENAYKNNKNIDDDYLLFMLGYRNSEGKKQTKQRLPF